LKSGSALASALGGGPKPEAGSQKVEMGGGKLEAGNQKLEEGKKNPASGSVQGKLKEFVQHVSSKRPQIGSLLAHVKLTVLSGETIYFQLDPGGIWMDLLSERKAQIEEMAGAFFGRPLRVAVQEGPPPPGEETARLEGESSARNPVDPIVHSAMNILNAKIDEVNS